ncbi:BRO-N domain-containing protein [Streptococcus macedonicus]|uniref:Bro-N domain-containing protein n=1 Tax=Streptococcus macedonicus TaxID=59310 RepID=A0A2G3NRB9_STRMC|nr:Bro-N domain-containing protein [Streptococcus macedonicus]KEH53134.1 antirepressor [Streptococcus macedonicus]MCW8485699.1 Bro-N domain-containing protein [Streptococcus macedonicus]MCW8493922.1 Bro-N domain-containing protein [Streptococcus macedonicus]MCW8499133.1 Bro-N domain-containing protein [Streptococcus macedonicus]MCW8501202.1 Bro-N domain-containing protein [Streptococcus macedonicus]
MEKLEQWNGHSIRFVEHNSEWWAVLADIARALNLRTDKVKMRLEDDHLSRVGIKDNLGRQQEMLIVNEFGIYETIFSSRKPEAKAFKVWVFEIIKQLRQQSGLEGFQAFRMLDKQHQKNAMTLLSNGLQEAKPKDMIKANTIANKAISNKYGYPKMVKKSEMTESMLRDREQALDETVELMLIKERYGLNISVADTIYSKTS